MVSATVNESKNIADSALEDASGVEPKTFTRVIFDRIGTLERTRLQTQCLLALSALPVWNHLVFRGAVALHGVHLHGRCSRDLDFLAPAEIKIRFIEIAAEQGLTLHTKEGQRIPFFPMQGMVFKEITVGIDVCSRELSEVNAVPGVFRGAGGVKIPVQVLALIPQMAEKLRAISRRKRPTDFYDVWLFAQKYPHFLPDLQELLHSNQAHLELYEFSAQDAWTNLQHLRPSWHRELIPLMPQVPSFEAVERDLARTMEFLAAAPTLNS